MKSFRSRRFNAYLAYNRHDAATATRLVEWLRSADINVWFDENALSHGSAVGDELAVQIADCQGFILLASKESLNSKWVQREIALANDQAINDPMFTMTIIRLDDVDIRALSPSIGLLKWIEPGGSEQVFAPEFIVQTVNSIFGRRPHAHLGTATDVFVSRSDTGPTESAVANSHCRKLLDLPNIRLIGDSLDQPHFDELRIRRLMSSCTGHLLVLPHYASEERYKYFVRERRISRQLQVPALIVCRADSPLPAELQNDCHLVKCENGVLPDDYSETFSQFLDDARAIRPKFDASAFFAHEYGQNVARNRAAAELIAAVTGCQCKVGLDFTGAVGTRQITDGILSASWFLSDFASEVDSKTGRIKLNVNSCIEAGIALGAGFGMTAASGGVERTIYAVCRDPQTPEGKTKDVPFMLRSSVTVEFYKDELDFLAKVHRIARQQRRRVINLELS